jgi:pyridoxal phosphate enzyme (YggS family)
MNNPIINLENIKTNIAKECGRSDYVIEAVSKGQPLEKIAMLLEHGHRVFAENKVQEAKLHWESIKPNYPHLKLHLIGALQSNKIRPAVKLFDVIETVDSIELAELIAKEAAKIGKIQEIMLQVNIGAEPQKSGSATDELPELVNFCKQNQCLNLSGLMCIPPHNQQPEPYFAQMQKLQQQFGLPYLSMGMSGDYVSAIKFGATHIRLGTALFGERKIIA